MKVPPMEPMTIAMAIPQVRPRSFKLISGLGTKTTTLEVEVLPPLSTARILKLNSVTTSKEELLMFTFTLCRAGNGSKVQLQLSIVSVTLDTFELGVKLFSSVLFVL